MITTGDARRRLEISDYRELEVVLDRALTTPRGTSVVGAAREGFCGVPVLAVLGVETDYALSASEFSDRLRLRVRWEGGHVSRASFDLPFTYRAADRDRIRELLHRRLGPSTPRPDLGPACLAFQRAQRIIACDESPSVPRVTAWRIRAEP